MRRFKNGGETGDPFLHACLVGNEILPHLYQTVRQPPRSGVAVDRIPHQAALIGFVFAHE